MARKKRGATVSLKDLATAIHKVVQDGNEDADANVQAVAEMVGLTPTTVKTRISQARKKIPQMRLLNLDLFFHKAGPRQETINEDDMNAFVAELTGQPIDKVEAEVEEIREEIAETQAQREQRKQERDKTATATAS